MKNRPLLVIGFVATATAWIVYRQLGGISGIARDPAMSVSLGVLVLILVPTLWLQYRRLKREPTYVDVEAIETKDQSSHPLGDTPLILVAKRTKIMSLVAGGLLSFGLLALMMWGQPGVCRTAGLAAFSPFFLAILIGAVVGLIWPEVLEISPQGLRNASFWRSQLWAWDEIGAIGVMKLRIFGRAIDSGIRFRRQVADSSSSSGSDSAMLRPVWPIRDDDLAALIRDARNRWRSPAADSYVPARTRLVDRLSVVLAVAPVALLLWLLIEKPCG